MTPKPALACVALLVTGFTLWVHAEDADSRPLPALVPSGAVLYVEARDFHTLLHQWNGSQEKARWLRSSNYSVMSQSRLLQRLSQVNDEFGAAAQTSVDLPFLAGVAGTRSALAIYDLSSNVQLVYLSRISENKLDGSALWRQRTTFQPREVSGIPFYLKADQNRTVAFAAYKGWLVVATDETRMADTLALLAGNQRPSLGSEPWFEEASAERPDDGDLRLIYNISALLRTPQFRSYWIQRNASELKPFSAGVSVLTQQPSAFEEQRTLMRAAPAVTAHAAALGDVLAFAPEASSLYRAWANPESSAVHDVLRQVLIGENVMQTVFEPSAPSVDSSAPDVGSESDIEIRIDEAPFRREEHDPVQPVLQAIEAMQPTSMLHVQTTTVLQDRVFVYPNSGAVFICEHPDEAALEAAVRNAGAEIFSSDLDPVTVKVDGNAVIVSRIALQRHAGVSEPVNASAVSVYNHALEWPHYKKLFALVDASRNQADQSPDPAFFSSNVRGLGDALSRLQRASITTRDLGTKIVEDVRYELAPPK